jgi:nucleotide-binding universal stress UspA family protein
MRIMVCYDTANESGGILDLARQHAKAFSADLYVATVLIGSDVDQLDNIEEAKKKLSSIEIEFQDDGISIETKLMFGGQSAGENLVDYAKEHDIDEIIIGTRKKSKLGKLIFGSTAQYVILEAHCPVISTK